MILYLRRFFQMFTKVVYAALYLIFRHKQILIYCYKHHAKSNWSIDSCIYNFPLNSQVLRATTWAASTWQPRRPSHTLFQSQWMLVFLPIQLSLLLVSFASLLFSHHLSYLSTFKNFFQKLMNLKNICFIFVRSCQTNPLWTGFWTMLF